MIRNVGDYDYIFNIILIGDRCVGKSSMLLRYTRNEFNQYIHITHVIDFALKHIVIDGKTVKAQIWDPSANERVKSISTPYYRGCIGALLIYDVCEERSFRNLDKWLRELREHGDSDVFVMLIGNKTDLKHRRVIKTEDGANYARQHGMAFIETSAYDSNNINFAFESFLNEIYQTTVRVALGGRP